MKGLEHQCHLEEVKEEHDLEIRMKDERINSLQAKNKQLLRLDIVIREMGKQRVNNAATIGPLLSGTL